jgi:DNA-binding NarL/FixJ family response regulator
MLASVLLISSDLACASSVAGAASRTGMTLRTAMGVSAIDAKLAEQAPALVLLDLSMAGVAPAELVPKLRASLSPDARVLAFGSHVHTRLLAAAREAGCDLVVSRGELFARIDGYLTPPRGPIGFPAGE